MRISKTNKSLLLNAHGGEKRLTLKRNQRSLAVFVIRFAAYQLQAVFLHHSLGDIPKSTASQSSSRTSTLSMFVLLPKDVWYMHNFLNDPQSIVSKL